MAWKNLAKSPIRATDDITLYSTNGSTYHLGKNKFGNAFDPANLEQIQILLTEGFGYQGILYQDCVT